MSNKKTKSADIKRRLNDDIKDESPFRSIVLKEKAETQKPKKKVNPKKPSDIVQGYNPKASFADILFSYEHTGNPYSMPKSQKKKIAEKKSDFASILAKWEGTDSKNIAREHKKSIYKPTKSFEEILSEYEGAPAAKDDVDSRKAEKQKTAAATDSGKYQRKSAEYKPSKSFGDILSSYEHPDDARKVNAEKITAVSKKQDTKPKKADDKPISETLFKVSSEYKRDPSASWSVLGGNDSYERPVPIKEEKAEYSKEEKPKSSYKPKKDFSEILSAYENNRSIPNDEEKAEAEPEKPREEGSTLFRRETEDDKRAPGAAWSVFGGNESFVRIVPEDSSLPEIEPAKHEHYKPSVDFSSILNDYEKEDVKTFEDILKEKGEQAMPKSQLTITQLRIMKPQATLDLHQLTQTEAEAAIKSFLSECHDNGIRKISIITGKGLHSEDGVGILRSVTDRILDESGLVSEKKSAPQNAGGTGALWIILKA